MYYMFFNEVNAGLKYIFIVSSKGQDSIMTTPLGSSSIQWQITVHLRFHPAPPLLLLHQVGVLHLRGHRHQPLQGVQAAFSLLKVPEGDPTSKMGKRIFYISLNYTIVSNTNWPFEYFAMLEALPSTGSFLVYLLNCPSLYL